jgi:uncharacterized protein YcbK (DUF882 family)
VNQVNRRTFLKLGTFAAAAAMLPRHALGFPKSGLGPERSLAFVNTHTSERLKTVYWVDGDYVTESLLDINRILRDHLANEMKEIDRTLLDLLYAIGKKLETQEPFHIISGYRSAGTNAFLRAHSSGVAENSLHTVGKAVDIRTPARELGMLRKVAVALKGGGVGYYPKSDFIHVDVGRVRYW